MLHKHQTLFNKVNQKIKVQPYYAQVDITYNIKNLTKLPLPNFKIFILTAHGHQLLAQLLY